MDQLRLWRLCTASRMSYLLSHVSLDAVYSSGPVGLLGSIVIDSRDPAFGAMGTDAPYVDETTYLSRSACFGPMMYTVAPLASSVVVIMRPMPCEVPRKQWFR